MSSNTKKRIQGAAQELGGKIKKGVGALLGNERMEADGRVAEIEGEAKQAIAKGAARIHGAAQEAGGAAKKGVGKVLDNKQMEVEGRAKELEGKARRGANH